jgi:hypothetical protein
MVSVGEKLKLAFASEEESIPSEKWSSRKFGANANQSVTNGAIVSGEASKTEFWNPGVPPEEEMLAIQLLASEHGSFGFINSKV